MEAVGAELLEQPVASESVFDRVFDLGEMAFDTSGGVQVVVQALEDVGGGGVDVGDWFGGDTTRRVGVGAAATAWRVSWLTISALAKNNGASQRNRTSPGTRRAVGRGSGRGSP